MSRALITLGVGPHAELLDIALPTFEAFAQLHGYDVIVPELECDRPPSWWKVPSLLAVLAEYDEALWVDADVVIIDPTQDIPADHDTWQAVVEHETADGLVPNMGVWFVRRPMIPILEQVWGMTSYIHHPWWEQGAMVELMGYAGAPLRPNVVTNLYACTTFLDQGWNCHIHDRRPVAHSRFAHATMHADRAAAMRAWAAAA